MAESEGVALEGISLIDGMDESVGDVESDGIGMSVDVALLVGASDDGIAMDGDAGSDGIGMLMSCRRSPAGEASAEIEMAAAEPATTAINATAEMTEEDFRTVVTFVFPSPPTTNPGKLTCSDDKRDDRSARLNTRTGS